MKDSKIEWTRHTFNPWEGCTKVSAGCANCYAETRAKRYGSVVWGPNGTRRVASESYWQQPLKWDREAKAAGERHRVFCASLADVFEDWRGPMVDAQGRTLYTFGRGSTPWTPSPGSPPPGQRPLTMGDTRLRVFDLIRQTPNLDWLLLTKRPENVLAWIANAMNIAWGVPQIETPLGQWVENWLTHHAVPRNVWLGTSVENQAAADERIPHLLAVPAAVRFLSCEPLLGAVDLTPWLFESLPLLTENNLAVATARNPFVVDVSVIQERVDVPIAGIDWVIAGGESGHGARPMHPDWPRSLRDQCQAAGVAFHLKQHGEYKPHCELGEGEYDRLAPLADPDDPESERLQVKPQVHVWSNHPVQSGTLATLYRVGKKEAGRTLDGQTWDEFPAGGGA